jgi:hypothetical protein
MTVLPLEENDSSPDGARIGVLRCHYEDDFTGPLAIPLTLKPIEGAPMYARDNSPLVTVDRQRLAMHEPFRTGPFSSSKRADHNGHEPYLKPRTIIIQRDPEFSEMSHNLKHVYLENWPTNCTLIKAIPEHRWISKDKVMSFRDDYTTGALIFEHISSEAVFAIVFGIYQGSYNNTGVVSVYETHPDINNSPNWLRDWKSTSSIPSEWFPNHSLESSLAFTKNSISLDISVEITKGYLMGKSVFFVNPEVLTRSLIQAEDV